MTFPLQQPDAGCTPTACEHFLRFKSLFNHGRGISVPCDAVGIVDMDSLSDRLRNTYLGARALVGREYSCPTVETVL